MTSVSRVSPFRRLVPFALAVALAGLAAGCSSKPPVLAKVGKTAITTEDFLEVARSSQGRYSGSADSAKRALLNDLVQRELLVNAGRDKGLVSAEDRERALKEAREQLALRSLIESAVPREVPVSDAEVKALYDERARESHVLVVFTPDRAGIDEAQRELRGGADFAATADRFNTTGLTPKAGDLGFRPAGSLMPALDSVVVHAPVGQVVGPIESPGDGWFLVKIVERRKRTQEPWEQIKEPLRQAIRESKRRALIGRWQKDLLAQYHVTVQPGAAQVLFARYNTPQRDTIENGAVKQGVAPPPTPEQARRVLVTYDGPGGRKADYTLGDAVRDLQDPTRVHPNFSMVPVIDQWLQSAVLQKVATLEAQRRHFTDEATLERRAQAQVDNVLLQQTYESLVLSSANPTPADLRAAYERHAAQLVGPGGRPTPFDSLPPQVVQALQGEAVEVARERRLKQLTDSLRAAIRPEIHFDRLKRIPWPVPPAPAGT